jgi:hypothetical protein
MQTKYLLKAGAVPYNKHYARERAAKALTITAGTSGTLIVTKRSMLELGTMYIKRT